MLIWTCNLIKGRGIKRPNLNFFLQPVSLLQSSKGSIMEVMRHQYIFSKSWEEMKDRLSLRTLWSLNFHLVASWSSIHQYGYITCCRNIMDENHSRWGRPSQGVRLFCVRFTFASREFPSIANYVFIFSTFFVPWSSTTRIPRMTCAYQTFSQDNSCNSLFPARQYSYAPHSSFLLFPFSTLIVSCHWFPYSEKHDREISIISDSCVTSRNFIPQRAVSFKSTKIDNYGWMPTHHKMSYCTTFQRSFKRLDDMTPANISGL